MIFLLDTSILKMLQYFLKYFYCIAIINPKKKLELLI